MSVGAPASCIFANIGLLANCDTMPLGYGMLQKPAHEHFGNNSIEL